MNAQKNQEETKKREPVEEAPEKKEPVIPLARETKPPEEEKPVEAEVPAEEATPPPPTAKAPPPEPRPKEVVVVPRPPRPSRPAGILRFIRAQIFTRTRIAIQRKILKPITTRLAKTAVGKAIKEGVKKGATWVAAKLGIQAAITAAGAATAEISAGVSLLISAAINLAIEVATRVLGKAKDFIKKLFEKPETLIATGVVLGALGFVVTAPISILFWGTGGILIVTGTAIASPALIAGATAGISGFFSQVAAAPTAFFSALGAPISATALVILMIGIIGGLSAATFFQVMTTSSAFILPHIPEEIGEAVTIGEPVEPGDPGDKSLHLAERVIGILKNCKPTSVTHVRKSNLETAVNCLNASDLSDFEKSQINHHFSYSTNKYTYLQCVGFMQGIMAALGKLPDRKGNAARYLDPPPPDPYKGPYYRDRADEIRRDDLVMLRGDNNIGHIGIVVGKEGDLIRVAQAFGDPRRGKGSLQITRADPVYYDGFLAPPFRR